MAKKRTRIEKYIEYFMTIKVFQSQGAKINTKEIATKLGIDNAIVYRAIMFGLIKKEGGKYVFLKEITEQNINELLESVAEYKKQHKIKSIQQPDLFNGNHDEQPTETPLKVTAEMMLAVVKHLREHPDMIDNMLQRFQTQIEDQFNIR